MAEHAPTPPTDEHLVAEARRLGVRDPESMPTDELEQTVVRRLNTIDESEPETLRSILEWAGENVDPAIADDRRRLAERIVRLRLDGLDELDRTQLETLLRLYDIPFDDEMSDRRLRRLLQPGNRLRRMMRRTRRRLAGYIVNKALHSMQGEPEQPEPGVAQDDEQEESPVEGTESEGEPKRENGSAAEPTNGEKARARKLAADEHIKRKGLVQGLTSYVRGTVDEYVAQKLDEIEARIDIKLDQIDRRMDDWRRRELEHRLRILKITLVVTAAVAIVSLVYELIKRLLG
jgi:hypothetical protein